MLPGGRAFLRRILASTALLWLGTQSVIIHKNEKLGLEITSRTRRYVEVRRNGDRVRISAGAGEVGGDLLVRASGEL